MKRTRRTKLDKAARAAGVAALIGLTGLAVGSDETYYNDEKEEGWFWYEDFLVEEEKEKESPEENRVTPLITAPQSVTEEAGERPPTFSVQWLQEKIPKQLEVALDDPTDENVRAYAYLQRAAFDKAEGFARRFQEVVLTDPVLDESNRIPVATFARASYSKIEDEEQYRILTWLSKRVGFFYFHDSTCHFCQRQAPVLRSFAEKYGFQFINIVMRGEHSNMELPGKTLPNAGHAQKFRVRQVPALVLVAGPDKVAVISENLLSLDELESRTIIVARHLDVLGEGDERRLAPRSTFEYVSNKPGTDVDEDDPATWINRIRADLGLEELR